MNNFKISIALFVVFLTFTKSFSQCNTTNFTVSKVNATCFSNASITVSVPTSTDCSSWIAEIVKTTAGSNPSVLSIPATGGDATFNSLTAGNYNISLSNGFTTIQYAGNPVSITSSYVNMSMTFSSVPPTCKPTASGYTVNGTFTSMVTGGVGPFIYKLTTSNGVQTATSPLRNYTFNNVPGGEQVFIEVTDLVNGSIGCENTIYQSPILVATTTSELAYGFRHYNFIRDCDNCTVPKMFINLDNLTPARRDVLLQPGNAIITIAGVNYPLTYIPAQNRFTYDPVATGGPNLTHGMTISTTFNWECNVLTKTSTVTMSDTSLNVYHNVLLDTATCTNKYKIVVIGDADTFQGYRDVYFCPTNTVVIERRVSTSPDVWQVVSGSDITPDPATLTAGLPVVGAFTSIIPSAANSFFVYQPGTYRVTASDACHSVSRTINIVDNIPIMSLNAYTRVSVLSGTVGLEVNTNSYTGPFPMSIQVDRVDGQTSIPITASGPLSYAGNYTVNFPIIKTFTSNPSWFNIMDLPPGEYKVKFTDACSAATGNIKEQTINLTNLAAYNPQVSVVEGCMNSNTINFNLNVNSYTYKPPTARLITTSGSVIKQVTTGANGSGSFTNVPSGNYIIDFTYAGVNGSLFSTVLTDNPIHYSMPVTVAPYQDFTVATSTILCDITNPNSGIVSAQIMSGTVIYPLTFSLYNVLDPNTSIQGPFTVNSPENSYVFTNVPLGNYFVRVSSICYSTDQNLTVSSVATVPTAQVSNPIICPNSSTTVAIISASNNLFDITWTDQNNNIIGTGIPITLAPLVTTTYTATFALKPIFGCTNTTTYQSNVTVTVTPNANLTLAVSDINLCDGTSPSITISNTQNEFSYEIVNSNGTSFSPPLIANGNGGNVTFAIPNTISLVAGQIFKVKTTNGNAGCTALLTDVCHVLSGTFNITCPTFPTTSVQCYADLPSQTSYTISQFQALGNGDGIIDVVGCGVIVITATNGANPGCNANAIRNYTITEYADPNNNDVRDSGENTILKTTTCSQTININDTTLPVVTGTLTASNINGCSIADAPAAITSVAALELAGLNISDNCTSDANLVVTSSDGTTIGTCPITFTRTYTIKDACNNATIAIQTINVNDTTAPVVTGTLTASNINGCSIADAPAAITSVAALELAGLNISDNCTSDANLVVTSSDGTATGTCPVTFTRTYTIKDACNNATIAIQTININDTTAPVVTGTLTASNINGCSIADAPAAMTSVAALELAGLNISDNCTSDANLVVTSSDGTTTGTCPITFIRTYTIKDACNNATTVTQTINVNDTIAPVVSGTLIASNTSGCSITDAPAAMTTASDLEAAGLTISDNCTTDANLVVTSSDGTATGTCPITFTRTYTIKDVCNNSTTITQTININDTTLPVLTGTLSLINASGCSIADAPAAMTSVAALELAGLNISDNCTTDSNLVVTSSDGTTTGTCPTTFTRTYTIKDACNNATTVTQTINVNDTIAPVVSGTLIASNTSGCSITDAPAAMTSVSQLETAGLTISDNCTTDANLVVTSSDGTATGTCPITFTRTYTIKDTCNNATTVTQIININDTALPVVTGTLASINASGCSIADAPAAMTSVSQLEISGLTISDNCTTDANLVVTSLDGTATGTCPITFTRTYYITDACNNSTTATQIININDTLAPIITGVLPDLAIIGCSIISVPSAMTTVSALESVGLTISDNCTTDANLVVTSLDGLSIGSCPITLVRTYTITDTCGNSTIKTQSITINDTASPVVSGELTPIIENGCSILDAPTAMTSVSQLETAGLTISDACTLNANLVVTHSDSSTSGTCPITFIRTYTLTDICGNFTSKTQTITINDTLVPVITGTLTASNINGCSIADAPAAMTSVSQLEVAGLTISDNCTTDVNLVVTSSDGTATGTCPITFTRTYTIKDACNNAKTATQTITINDTLVPVITGTLTASNINGCSIADAPAAMTSVSQLEVAGLTISDNCTTDVDLVVTSSDGTATGTCPITFTRTYTIKDTCNNATTVTQIININDTTVPVITGTLTASNINGCSIADAPTAMTTVAALEVSGLTISDNCTIDANLVVTSSDGTATGTCPITFTRTYTIKDTCNNATTVTQIININDTTLPVLTGTLASINASGCSIADAPAAMTSVSQLEIAGLTISDNCTTDANLVVISSDGTATGTCPVTFIRTYTIKDACNNATTVTQTININDTTAPVFSSTVPQDITIECNQTIPSAATVTATDNCNGLVTINFTEQNQPGTCPNNYSIIRTWVATDICGNSQTHTQQIIIQDTTPPVFVGNIPVNEVFAKCDGIPEAPVLTATDNCGSATVTYSEVKIDGDCTNKYRLERTWTATDACGNETQITQTVYLACYVTPYNALSPDGDGLNDVFIIEGLECYPNNTVQIVNRWGVMVFEATYYDNVNNVFRGFSDGRSTVSRNDKLPTGDYWYVLKYEYDLYGRTKENIEKIGYIYIQNE